MTVNLILAGTLKYKELYKGCNLIEKQSIVLITSTQECLFLFGLFSFFFENYVYQAINMKGKESLTILCLLTGRYFYVKRSSFQNDSSEK